MAGKSRQSANLTSKNNIFVDAVADNTGIGSASPKSKLDVVGSARISGILTVGISSSVTIDGNTGIVSATKLYAAGIDVASFIAGAGYANTSGIATYAVSSGIATYASSSGISTISSGLTTTVSVNTSGIITASSLVGSGSSITGIFINQLEDVDIIEGTISDGRALINVNGKWKTGPVIGGYEYFSGNDPYIGNVSIALPYDTDFLDKSGNFDQISSILVVTQSGTPGITTSIKKYGAGALSLNGTSYLTYTTLTNQSDFNIGTGDFTFELWARDTKGFSARGLCLFHGIEIIVDAGNNLSIRLGSTSFSVSSTFFNIINNWVYIAITRESGTVRFFTDGVLRSTHTGNTSNLSYGTGWIGRANPASPYNWTGQIDDIRYTKGIARYTSTFSPPSAAILGDYISLPYSINNLDDVDTSSNAPVTGQSLVWNQSTSKWEPGYTGLTTTTSVNTTGIITASSFVGIGSGLTGVIGVSTQWITTSAGIHTLSNVGIGTTNPTSKLDVRGDVIISGIITASSFVGNLTGTATTATTLTNDASVNTSGIVTATKFVGDGSGLSGIVAAGSGGISLQNDSNPVGTAGTINFDNNFDLEISGGIATVTLLTAPGLTSTASVNTTGIITASNFSGTFAGNFVGSGSSLTGVIGLSTQWITTSAGIHTLSKVGIGTTNPISTLEVFGNVNVAGTSGQLFSVVDNLSTGSIFSVNDISGIPSIDVNADGTIQLAPFNGNVGVGTTRPRARVDVIGTLWASNISVGVITATTFSGNLVTLVNGRTGIVSIGIVSMTDFLYQPQGVVTLTDRWDSYNAINSSGGWDLSSANSLTIVRLNWVPSSSQNGTSGSTWRTNFLDKVKAGDLVQWSKDGITWNSFIQPFDSVNTGSNSVGFYPGSSVPTGGSMYVRYITTKAVGVQPLQNGQILQYDSAYTKWMPFGPYANWESTSVGINTLRNVGIGTTNPTSRLTIEGGGINVRTTTSNSFLVLDAGIGPAAGNQVSFIDFKFNGDLKGNIAINESFSTTPLEINSAVSNDVIISSGGGRVGIGTTNPSSRLTVSGGILVSGVVTASSFIGTTFIGNLTGTATTANTLTSDASVNTSGVVTATKFVGDGSGLTGIVATSGGGVFIQNDNINIGAASTINFTSNFTVESTAGIVTVGINTASTITAAAFIGDGSGLTNVSGAGGASSRTTVSGITTVLVVNGIGNTEISGFKTYGLLKVGVSSASWVRLYTDSVSRSNDASRSIEVDPITGSGVIAEVATSGISTVKMTPFIIGFNDDNPVTNTIYVSVKNLSGISTSISVNLTILKMEE
jgi:hypothetical protein